MHEGHRERMWERLYFHGDSMSDHELLEILLYYTIPRKNTNPTAHDLLDRFGSLEALFSAPPEALEKVAGIGKKSAEFIHLVGQMIERVRTQEHAERRINCYADIVDFASGRFAGRDSEILEFYCIGAGGKLLCAKSFDGGKQSRVSLHARELNLLLASMHPFTLVAAHNHPSGVAEPSDEDDEAAEEIYRICRLNGVLLSDCLIFADGQAPYSYFLTGRFEYLGIDRSDKDQYIIKSKKLKGGS